MCGCVHPHYKHILITFSTCAVFNSGWKTPTKYYDGSLLLNVTGLTYNDQCPEGCGYTGSPYPFGVDPIWGLSGNKLSFLNSLKMKMSVLLGVLHMGWGVILTNFNYIHHKHLYGIWAEFIPQVCDLSRSPVRYSRRGVLYAVGIVGGGVLYAVG